MTSIAAPPPAPAPSAPAPVTNAPSVRALSGPRRINLLLASVVVGVWILSRLAAYLIGMRFDTSGLTYFVQFVDPPLLRHDLLRSVYYLHTQPPLFNLYLGIVLHLPRGIQHLAFAGSFAACGLVLALALNWLMIDLGVPPLVAVIATCIFIVGPSTLVYEHWLYYTYPVATLIVLAALALIRWQKTERTGWLVLFATALGCLGLTRSSYHVAWMAAVVVAILLLHPQRWRRTLPILAVPLILVGAVYVKNKGEFNYPAASSWQGQTLALGTTFRLPLATRQHMVANHELSPYALIQPFSDVSAYRALLPPFRPTGVPLLDRPVKSNGSVNDDYEPYVAIDRHYLTDDLSVIRSHPDVIVRTVGSSAVILVKPAEDYLFVRGNLAKLGPWYTGYATIVEGRMGTRPRDPRLPSSRPGLLIGLEYLLAAIAGVFAIADVIRQRRRSAAELLTAAFIAFTVGWVILESLLVDVGENNRFRYEVDPVVLALAVAAVVAGIRQLRNWRTAS